MEKWAEFKSKHPQGFYVGTYEDYTFIVYQHPSTGHLKGYVELKPQDIEFLSDKDIQELDCHGGITYQGNLNYIFKNSNKTYIGFDCNHLGDKAPFLDLLLPPQFRFSDEVWRDENFVEENCKLIINQIVNLRKNRK